MSLYTILIRFKIFLKANNSILIKKYFFTQRNQINYKTLLLFWIKRSLSFTFIEFSEHQQQNDNLQNFYMKIEKLIFSSDFDIFFHIPKNKIKHEREINQRKGKLQWQLWSWLQFHHWAEIEVIFFFHSIDVNQQLNDVDGIKRTIERFFVRLKLDSF